MKSGPPIGTIGEECFVVEATHAIDFADDELPAVLSTPWLIWFLEHAARKAVLPFLDAGQSTVGTEIELEHLAATPLGHRVVCSARVVRTQSNEVWFQLEARDETERIARGFHKLRIISKRRLADRVARKRRR